MWITWLPGVLLSVFAIIVLCWKGIRTAVKIQDALPTIYKIHDEFSPNGGGSMRDQIDGMRWETRKWQNQHARDDDRRFAKVEAALERIEDKLEP